MPNATTIESFDRDHADEGGVKKLLALYEEGASTSDIAAIFKLTTKQVNYYLKAVVGDQYLRYPWRVIKSQLRR